jgi:hypothetical protein
MRYRINEKSHGIDIRINDLKGGKERVLKTFANCQSGQCTCKSGQYNNIESIEIEEGDDEVNLRLNFKKNSKVDARVVRRCLDSTSARIDKK